MIKSKLMYCGLTLACIGGLLLNSSSALCGIYEYHPAVRPYLGGGFDPTNPTKTFGKCLVKQTAESVDLGGAAESGLYISAVRSELDIQKAVGVSTDISGKLLFLKLGLTTRFGNEYSFEEGSFTYVIVAKTTYGKEVLTVPSLMQEFKESPLLKGMELRQMRELCGPEIVVEQTRGVTLFGVFTLRNVTKEQKSFLSAHLNLKTGVFNGEVKAAVEKVTSDFQLASQMGIRIFAIGGNGIVELRDLVKAGTGALAIGPQKMADYMATMTRERSVPIAFGTMPIELFTGGESKNQVFQARFVEQMSEKLEEAERGIRVIERLLNDPSYNLTGEQVKAYQEKKRKFAEVFDSVRTQMERCYAGQELCMTTLNQILEDNRTAPVQLPEKKDTQEEKKRAEELKKQEKLKFLEAICNAEFERLFNLDYNSKVRGLDHHSREKRKKYLIDNKETLRALHNGRCVETHKRSQGL